VQPPARHTSAKRAIQAGMAQCKQPLRRHGAARFEPFQALPQSGDG
jgi:hypothetical protein